MRKIEVKKSELAMYRGLSLSNDYIANKLGITKAEVNDALIRFGMLKSRKSTKEYEIVYNDDTTVVEALSTEAEA